MSIWQGCHAGLRNRDSGQARLTQQHEETTTLFEVGRDVRRLGEAWV